MSFHWTPISDQEIRLLQRKGLTASGELSYDLHVFDNDKTPQYAAISYMFGPPPDDQLIYVNGLEVYVRQNCLDALRQVHLHDESEYIWLDRVCINQIDLDEKSRQVQSMGKIYRQADAVLACVAVGSTVPELRALKNGTTTLKAVFDFESSDEDPWDLGRCAWLRSLNGHQVQTLRRELNTLGALPYWNRLWIIQEIHLGKRPLLYVGDICLEWRGIIAMFKRLEYAGGELFNNWLEEGAFSNMMENEHRRKSSLHHLDRALDSSQHSNCSVPHDRIYGLRELIRWPESLGVMVPNYHLDPFELAQEALRYLRAEECEREPFQDRRRLPVAVAVTLLRALTVDVRNALVSQDIVQLETPWNFAHEMSRFADAVEHERRCHPNERTCLQHHPHRMKYLEVVELDRDEDGRYVAEFTKVWCKDEPSSVLTRFAPRSKESPFAENHMLPRQPVLLYYHDTPIGWLPGHARSGDYLVTIWRGEVGLVLRRVGESTILRIIGIFLLQPARFTDNYGPDPGLGELILHFDPVDLLVLATQYCSDDKSTETQMKLARTFFRNCNSRVTRGPFSSYAAMQQEEERSVDSCSADEHGLEYGGFRWA